MHKSGILKSQIPQQKAADAAPCSARSRLKTVHSEEVRRRYEQFPRPSSRPSEGTVNRALFTSLFPSPPTSKCVCANSYQPAPIWCQSQWYPPRILRRSAWNRQFHLGINRLLLWRRTSPEASGTIQCYLPLSFSKTIVSNNS